MSLQLACFPCLTTTIDEPNQRREPSRQAKVPKRASVRPSLGPALARAAFCLPTERGGG
ncbi:hypothetical protein ACHAW5_005589 [Stephanodiscus triporus]|uniref:Uncharacterized protein n=1 Tax=Stephanodiscus triporus TaxID=2934178 RepID=A0ABD3PPJ7_9STRA